MPDGYAPPAQEPVGADRSVCRHPWPALPPLTRAWIMSLSYSK
jgi:hypothetical protein